MCDTTKPGGAEAQLRYDAEIAGVESVEARYAIAVRYAKQYGRNPDVPPVTQDIVDSVLRANDYAPLFRGNLSAISYNVLRLVDIRRMVQLSLVDRRFAISALGYSPAVGNELPNASNGGSADENATQPTPLEKFVFAWARENFEDRGQTHESAQALATLAVTQGQMTNRVKLRPITRLFERAFRVGLIDRQQYTDLLAQPVRVQRQLPIGLLSGIAGGAAIEAAVEDMDIFDAANAAADLLDDAGSLAYLDEQDAIFAAEDQLEEGTYNA